MRTLVIIVSLLVSGRLAAAQSAGMAEGLFREGQRLLKEGRVAEACEAFSASQKIESSVSTLMNLAACHEKDGKLATAWDTFLVAERAARGVKKLASTGKVAKQRAEALEARLSYLTISVADEVQIDGLEVILDGDPVDAGAWNKALPIDGGPHTVSARAPGHDAWSRDVAVAVEHDRVSVEVPRFKQIRAPDAARVPPGSPTGATDPVDEDDDRDEDDAAGQGLGRRRIVALSVAGGGLVALAAGGVLGVQARDLERRADAICPDVECPPGSDEAISLSSRARSRAITADVLFVAGAAALGTGVVLWLTGGRAQDHGVEVTSVVRPDGASVLVQGAF